MMNYRQTYTASLIIDSGNYITVPNTVPYRWLMCATGSPPAVDSFIIFFAGIVTLDLNEDFDGGVKSWVRYRPA